MFKSVKVPHVNPPSPHWKVGDFLDDGMNKYQIGQIAVVLTKQAPPGSVAYEYAILFYDTNGNLMGSMEVIGKSSGDAIEDTHADYNA